MAGPERIRVTVVHAAPPVPFLRELAVPAGTSLRQAIERSGLLDQHPHWRIEALAVGVWGRARALEQLLADGDRVEIYRPLTCDPRQARRDRAGD
ncbi:MAG TPA: RnfH family protein [Gammaproteobacteria bacterium]|nr:RnfH family protein [Gammaproteobacteria bacterium]